MSAAPTVRWSYRAGSMLAGPPTVLPGGAVVVGCRDGSLHCVAADGAPAWTVATGGPVDAAACVHPDGPIVFGSYDGVLRAVDAGGATLWAFEVGAPVMTTPCVDDDGVLWFGADDGCLRAVSAHGRPLARIALTDLLPSSPLVSRGTVWIAADRRLWGSDGTRVDVAAETVTAPLAAGADGTIYVGSWDAHVHAVRRGEVVWSAPVDGQVVGGCAVGPGGEVVVGTRAGVVAAFSDAGQPLWSRRFRDGVYGCPALDDAGRVWFSCNDRRLHALTLDGGAEVATLRLGRDPRAAVAIAGDGTLYAASWDWHLYAVETGATGPAEAPWPQLGRTPRRTGNAATS